MNKFIELAQSFYGVKVPRFKVKDFVKLVISFLEERYSIETAIGKALQKMRMV